MSTPSKGQVPGAGEPPLGPGDLTAALGRLGVGSKSVLLVHASVRSLGRWLIGGPPAVVLALEECLGQDGTLVMPTHSADLSEPATWENPPVPVSWWQRIRDEMPAFRPDLTPSFYMGQVAECFRHQEGVLRSSHPQVSFAARGPLAEQIVGEHPLAYGLGDDSPLGRIYDAAGWVLLIGVDHSVNTSLHLAEYRCSFPGKRELTQAAPILVAGERRWVSFPDVAIDSDDFGRLGEAFDAATGLVRKTTVGDALWRLMPQRELVDFAVSWLPVHRLG